MFDTAGLCLNIFHVSFMMNNGTSYLDRPEFEVENSKLFMRFYSFKAFPIQRIILLYFSNVLKIYPINVIIKRAV